MNKLLIEAKFNKRRRLKIVKGFTQGFSLEYKGNKQVKKTAPNLPFRIGSPIILWNKVMKEVQANRYAGPFEKPPFEYFIQSPIGLVPKDGGTKTRLIFHLSYPRSDNSSVNAGIPKDKCSVHYPSFDEAVRRCLEEGKGCYISKSDMSMAFRNVPLNRSSWPFLILKAEHPITKKTYFFVDKCLPFGASISCAIFQEISDVIAILVQNRTRKETINYLDDYLFAALLKMHCDWQTQTFLDICKEINFPVSLEKTFWGSTSMTFLGLLLDTVNQLICIPKEKIDRAMTMLEYFLNNQNKKCTVIQLQRLCGFLNFLCKCIVPGRAFLLRLYAMVSSKMKPHHHLKITEEMRLDLTVWKIFLNSAESYCRPFMELGEWTGEDLEFYSDASKSWKRGVGAWCQNSWMYSAWDEEILEKFNPSIQYLELYGVVLAAVKWMHRFKNRKVFVFCDNKSVVDMINDSSSSNKNEMVLIRILILKGLQENVRIFAKHVKTKKNGMADALSRLQLDRFWTLVRKSKRKMEVNPVLMPEEIWPIQKVWIC